MRFSAIVLLFVLVSSLRGLMGVANAQIQYDPVTNRLVCARLNRSACLSESLTGSILISCASSTLAEIRSCNIELAYLLPDGYKDSAVCYQPSPKSDAVCAFNGTGYSIQGAVTSVPETVLCDFVNPSAAAKRSNPSLHKRLFKKSASIFSTILSKLTRILFYGLPMNIKTYEKRDAGNEETAYCSNPWSAKGSATDQDAATTTSMSLPLAFLPTVTPSDFTPVNLPNRFKVNATAMDTATTSYADTTIITRVVTVTAAPLTTTVHLTSTYTGRPIQSDFYLGTPSVASVASRMDLCRRLRSVASLFILCVIRIGFR